jgi:hypothetical protein
MAVGWSKMWMREFKEFIVRCMAQKFVLCSMGKGRRGKGGQSTMIKGVNMEGGVIDYTIK